MVYPNGMDKHPLSTARRARRAVRLDERSRHRPRPPFGSRFFDFRTRDFWGREDRVYDEPHAHPRGKTRWVHGAHPHLLGSDVYQRGEIPWMPADFEKTYP